METETIISEEQKKELPGDPSLPTSKEELKSLIAASKGDFKYSVEDFFKNPEKTSYQLSPDGTHFSYMGPYERRQNMFVQKIGEETAIRITSETDRDIAGYFWANDNRLLFIKDSAGDENFQLYAVDKDGKGAKDLTPFEKVRIQIIDQLEDIEDQIIIGMNKNNPQLFEPYRLNIESGDLKQIAENTNPAEPIDSWMTDHEGKVRIASKVVGGTNTTIMYRESEDQPFKDVLTTDFREGVQPLFFDFDNGNIVFATSNLGRDKNVIIKFDMATGKEVGTPIFEHPDVDVSNLTYSKKRKVLTTISYNTAKNNFHFLDKERESIQNRLEKELAGYEVFVTNMNKAEDKFMVRTYSDRSLGAYYFYDKNTDKLEKIVDVSPWINEEDMADMKPVQYKSRDGKTINGYLTLPKVAPLKNLPVIVNPHGGPWHRDTWGFNPEVQLFASRGYAVLQMNFRGSTGYGRDFWESSFKEWGKSMQDDITDGVQWLIDQEIADADRVAIYGGSYGGYATLAGVAFTPDLYKCAVDYVGVSNLFTFMKTIPPYWKPYLDMMYTMVGNPESDSTLMAAASPALHTDKIKTPLFVIQGANDPRVNIDEADQIVRSLRSRGVEVPYLVKYDEGHGFHNEENRFESYKAMVGFFAKHLRPDLKG
ncbi:MAG: dipeptidyl aminopeptidase/acylaminoacyl peptidase [Saprospiraceae bacterium]|jgi:dipeptidyl aminopeptidase/acylaminoacyl peptidase